MPEKAHENSSFQKKFTVLENINVGSISCVDKWKWGLILTMKKKAMFISFHLHL